MITDLLWALAMGLTGALVFAGIGLVSGTDETSTLGPLTLLVVLLGVPPAGVITFFLASAIAKHMTHAIPTTLLGIPGDTTAVALLDDAWAMRRIGAPHVALRKALAGGLLSAAIAVPIAVGVASLLAPFAEPVKEIVPYVFVAVALVVAYFSPGRWAAIAGLAPFTLVIAALSRFAKDVLDKPLSISFFLGIAIGPLVIDLLIAASRSGRGALPRSAGKEFSLAPEAVAPPGWFPNPFKVLTRGQTAVTGAIAAVTSTTFMLSPVATAVMAGEAVGSRIKHPYQRLSTLMAVKNGTTESTYIAETLIPLIAFGLPLSPVAAGPAAALFNAPPVFTVKGQVHNLHTLLTSWQFLVFGLLAVAIVATVIYPLAMRHARPTSAWVARRISHEALIGAFAGLICVVAWYEGGVLGLLVTVSVGALAGAFHRLLGMTSGAQYMAFYVATLSVPLLIS
ncbi:tripartite tricarboxylate transporter permease [Streptomyces sp. BE20]|uniref:tripartite tricarboxylate transporter permease n=1 Tax=unclassified Streptomyces TaxID=2593676 RepID=UPI002E78C8E7|nr:MULTISPECIES: tripartite tricarboxylate transporter permease [unclassified Streptomyces]MED7947642.1 tripartite tricarboxylate transporter permease [Streptomyces sp. BE303]MEE1824081.1 tripartite tricarboxylate transporter permease [Streptomyces sp. BE20]